MLLYALVEYSMAEPRRDFTVGQGAKLLEKCLVLQCLPSAVVYHLIHTMDNT